MIKLLLLSAGTNACYHIAKILKEKFANDFYIIGADINDNFLLPDYHYLDKCYKVPYTSDPCYYDEILKICETERINYILPSFDADQQLFYPENPDLQRLGVLSFGTSKETLSIYADKIKMYEFLKSKGFPLPQRYSISDINDTQEYFIKPINGVASIGARKILSKDIKLLPNTENFIIQEVCSEPEYTLECFTFEKQLSTVCRERIATKTGVCVKAKIFNSTKLEKIAMDFISAVATPYCFNLQFMKNQNDEYVITDVNLRTAGGMSLSYAAGWDEVSALAHIMKKQSKDIIFSTLSPITQTQYVVRAYTDIVTKAEKNIIAFDWDGTLLDSRNRHKIVMNFVLSKFSVNIDTSDLIEFKRQGKNNVDFLVSKGIDKNLATEIQLKWIENIEKPEFLTEDKLYPETIELLQQYSKDYDLILLTARTHADLLRKQVKDCNVAHFFKDIFVVSPSQKVTDQKAKVLREQQAILMIGDTQSDALAASQAGIEFKFCENGFHSKETVGAYL